MQPISPRRVDYLLWRDGPILVAKDRLEQYLNGLRHFMGQFEEYAKEHGVPDRDVRINAALDQPAEHLAGTISDVGGEVIGRKGEARNGPLEHRLGGMDLFGDAGRCRLDVDDDRVGQVDQ